ncbi:hypothetical protein QTH87_25560 [Variovorax sp. J22P168]|uniref:hypothetical protein n=1 Tax=Variovorax jilinensis TaxID=3053513 RepID=UPI00257635C1|nr:hypothetical protein [Variovorax sp. J22P168]MDM0015832.1 hypothetical protein [Variovorax sp. J22P168]
MSNPWTKKNPLMSMWLSAANRTMGSAKGQVAGAAKQQASAIQAEATRQIVDFWSGQTVAKASRRKTRR